MPFFALFYHFVFEGNFQVQAHGAYIRRGDLTEGFFALRVWGSYIGRGLYMEGLIFGIFRCLICCFLFVCFNFSLFTFISF